MQPWRSSETESTFSAKYDEKGISIWSLVGVRGQYDKQQTVTNNIEGTKKIDILATEFSIISIKHNATFWAGLQKYGMPSPYFIRG